VDAIMKAMPTNKTLPLDIVGSTVFGRYPKIGIEQTYNMIISDDWLVPYAGYQKVASIMPTGEGRGIYNSIRYRHLIVVIDNGVYAVNQSQAVTKIANIRTFSGDVFMDENNAGQIAICDKSSIYIFDYVNNTFQRATLDADFIPGYVCFQDGYFIAPNLKTVEWRLSALNNGLSWPTDSSNVGLFQTKPNNPLATIRMPGKGNLLMVFGSTVTELWSDLGQQLFPYQKNSYFNVDYGCLNPATIAASDKFVVWLGVNDKSGPVIMYSDGGNPVQISNDGINFKFAQLTNPENSYGFLFKQDGHLIYQFSFPDDNLTYAFDFNTQKFFTLCDENMDYHIAKRVVYANNTYYFISQKNGNLYELNTRYTTYDGKEIPRIRVTKNIRTPDSERWTLDNATFPLEAGEDDGVTALDLSISTDGGQSFGSYDRQHLNAKAHRISNLNYWRKGAANDFVLQFRFWGTGRFVATNGQVSISR
jgi:hypothetical protein